MKNPVPENKTVHAAEPATSEASQRAVVTEKEIVTEKEKRISATAGGGVTTTTKAVERAAARGVGDGTPPVAYTPIERAAQETRTTSAKPAKPAKAVESPLKTYFRTYSRRGSPLETSEPKAADAPPVSGPLAWTNTFLRSDTKQEANASKQPPPGQTSLGNARAKETEPARVEAERRRIPTSTAGSKVQTEQPSAKTASVPSFENKASSLVSAKAPDYRHFEVDPEEKLEKSAEYSKDDPWHEREMNVLRAIKEASQNIRDDLTPEEIDSLTGSLARQKIEEETRRIQKNLPGCEVKVILDGNELKVLPQTVYDHLRNTRDAMAYKKENILLPASHPANRPARTMARENVLPKLSEEQTSFLIKGSPQAQEFEDYVTRLSEAKKTDRIIGEQCYISLDEETGEVIVTDYTRPRSEHKSYSVLKIPIPKGVLNFKTASSVSTNTV